MSYVKAPGLGIGQGIGTQAMADLPEYVVIAQQVGDKGKQLQRARSRKALSGTCCTGCSHGAGCASLGATGFNMPAQGLRITGSPQGSPVLGGASGGHPILKLALVAGVIGGGVYLYRRFRKKA